MRRNRKTINKAADAIWLEACADLPAHVVRWLAGRNTAFRVLLARRGRDEMEAVAYLGLVDAARNKPWKNLDQLRVMAWMRIQTLLRNEVQAATAKCRDERRTQSWPELLDPPVATADTDDAHRLDAAALVRHCLAILPFRLRDLVRRHFGLGELNNQPLRGAYARHLLDLALARLRRELVPE